VIGDANRIGEKIRSPDVVRNAIRSIAMTRGIVLLYGIMAYLAFGAVFGVMIGFLADVDVVRSMDTGATAPLPAAIAIDLALLALFGVPHSVMARPWFKDALARVLPRTAERSTYVLVASLSLGLIAWQWRALPEVVWSVSPPASYPLWAVSGLGIVLVVFSTFLTSHFDLVGLRQVVLAALDREYTPVPFIERSLYRVVRHPMMSGMLLWFWAAPTMSVGHLVFAAGMTVYIVAGVRMEERALARTHGEAYRAYCARVPAFFPTIRPSTSGAPVSTVSPPPECKPRGGQCGKDSS
jgi:protein-S-isoprenylcysteine O-methyltransferase Ste14